MFITSINYGKPGQKYPPGEDHTAVFKVIDLKSCCNIEIVTIRQEEYDQRDI